MTVICFTARKTGNEIFSIERLLTSKPTIENQTTIVKRFSLSILCAVWLYCEILLGQSPKPRLNIGDPLPDLALVSAPGGESRGPNDYSHYRILVFLFLSTHCGMAAAHNEVFNSLAAEFHPQKVLLLGVYSGKKETLQGIGRYFAEKKLIFPGLKDIDNQFADQLGARVTPEAFVFDQSRRLRYRGSVDALDDPKGSRDRYLRQALEAVLQDRSVPLAEPRPFGCIIDRQVVDRQKVRH
jgi:peroxiredoxin